MTAVKLKGNYTYPRFRASRRLHVTQTVSLRRVVKSRTAEGLAATV